MTDSAAPAGREGARRPPRTIRPLPGDAELRELLAARLDQDHIDARLRMEALGPQPALGTRLFLRPIEKWLFSERAMRAALKLLGLYERGRRNALAIRVTRHRVPVAGLPAAFHGYRILQLTDLHLDMNEALPDALIRVVAGLEYDLAVLTGDYRYETHGSSEPDSSCPHVRLSLLNTD